MRRRVGEISVAGNSGAQISVVSENCEQKLKIITRTRPANKVHKR